MRRERFRAEEDQAGKPGLAPEGAPPPAYAPDIESGAAAQEPTVGQLQPRVEEPAGTDERPRLNAFWDYGAVLESLDKAFRFHLGGRLDSIIPGTSRRRPCHSPCRMARTCAGPGCGLTERSARRSTS